MVACLKKRGHVIAGGKFSPLKIAGLMAWYKADAITGLSDGDPVASWLDSSGNGNTLTQATPAKRPLWKSPGIGSLPGVRYDGSDDVLSGAAFAVAVAQPTTIFVVASTTDVGATNRQVFSGLTAGARQVIYQETTVWKLYAGVVLASATAPTAAAHLFTALFNGAASDLRLDRVSIKSGNAGAFTLDGVRLGASDVPDKPWQGDIGEVLLYSGSVSTADRTLLETYLARWGV